MALRGRQLIPNYLVLIILVVFSLAPMVVMVSNAFKSNVEIGHNPLGLPTQPILDNFPRAWEIGNFSLTLRNTLVLVIGTVAGVVSLGGMAAYSLARLNMPGASGITLYLLLSSSLPIQLFLIPLFTTWRSIGLTNNLFGLILIYIAVQAPFAIFLMRSYMLKIPGDFEDAARVDGANELQVFTHVLLPLAWPGMLTAGLVVALYVWNEFLLASIFLTQQQLFTNVSGYYNFTSRFSRDWGLTSAAALMMTLPVIVLFLALQRRFIEGLTQGGLKG